MSRTASRAVCLVLVGTAFCMGVVGAASTPSTTAQTGSTVDPIQNLSCNAYDASSSTTKNGKAAMWVSLYEGPDGNGACELGKEGMQMSSLLVRDTQGQCVESDVLQVFGKPFYMLSISSDQTVVTAWNALCNDSSCKNCDINYGPVPMQHCQAGLWKTGGSMNSVAFTAATNDTCLGPYTNQSTEGFTLYESVSVNNPHTGKAELGLVFASSFSAKPGCHVQSMLGTTIGYQWTSSQSQGETVYSLNTCSSVDCSDHCTSLFSDLPVNQCISNQWNNLAGHVKLFPSSALHACTPKPIRNPKVGRIVGVVFLAVALITLLAVVVTVLIKRTPTYGTPSETAPLTAINSNGGNR
eukprot:m.38983 g.38983  ORF g.38983 m.38983 type:complete len:354 (-) comp10274_c0_seq1:692-1753(-)